MPLYSAVCPQCGKQEDYVRKIDERHLTPSCCNAPMDKMITASMVQAQSVSGLITVSDGSVHEGRNAFERHMAKNDLIHGSDSSAESKYRKAENTENSKKDLRSAIDKAITQHTN